MRRIWILVACAALLAAWIPAAQAAPGDLDTTFGTNGFVATAEPNGHDLEATNIAENGDGLFVAGTFARYESAGCGGCFYTINDFELARYDDATGALDTSFGTNGFVTTSFGQYNSATLNGLAIQEDGKIVVGGWYSNPNTSDTGLALARYNSDGSLDTSTDGTSDEFGTGGTVMTPIASFSGPSEAPGNLFIQSSDGYIVVGGTSNTGKIELARYDTSGVLDPGFGTSGIETSNVDGQETAVADGGGGNILVGATGCDTLPACDHSVLEVVRFGSGGAPDPTFGSSGVALGPAAADGVIAHNLKLQPGTGGEIVIVGQATEVSGNVDFEVDRFTATGDPDTTFGTDGNGAVITDFGTNGDEGTALATKPDGTIVVAGETEPPAMSETVALARYRPDGTPDTTFGSGGKTTATFPDGPAETNAILVDGSQVVTAGKVDFGGDPGPPATAGSHFALTRFDDGVVSCSYNGDATIDGKGRHIFNFSGRKQTSTHHTARGHSTVFVLKIYNVGTCTDSFSVQGPAHEGPFDATYLKGLSGTIDITRKVLHGTYTIRNLAPGASAGLRLKVDVRPGASAGDTGHWVVTFGSSHKANHGDAVRARDVVT